MSVVASGLLVPVTPNSTTRYQTKKACSKLNSWVIRPGNFVQATQSQAPQLLAGWTAHVQPEGQMYFTCETKPRIVTDAYMYSPVVQARVLRYAAITFKSIEDKGLTLQESAECYLKPDDDDDEICYYYIADHATHTVFWLSEYSTDELGLPKVSSESLLQFVLSEEYWNHVEQFPTHCTSSLFLAIDELVAILVQGESDQRTSRTSTFPYSAKECKNLLRLLQLARHSHDQPPSAWVIARVWGAISRHRYHIQYSHEHARLDRTQHVLDLPREKRGLFFGATSRLMFGIPANYANQLETVWSDDLVYAYVWREFITNARQEWTQHLTWSLGLSILNAVLLMAPGASGLLTTLALAGCAIAALSSMAVIMHHQYLAAEHVDNAWSFLHASAHDAHRRTALAFSLPRVLFLYAFGLTAAQGVFFLARATDVRIIAALALLVFLVSLPWARWAAKLPSVRCWRRRGGVKLVDEEQNVLEKV